MSEAKVENDRRIGREASRVARLRLAAEQMQRGHFDVGISIEGSDEVARLGEALGELARTLGRRFHELGKLAAITERVNAGVMLEEVLDRVYESFRAVIPYERIGLALLEDQGRTVRARWARSDGTEIRLKPGYSAKLEGSSLEEIIRSGRPRILNDLEAYLEEHPSSEATRLVVDEGLRSSLTCPLVALGKPIGFLFFSSRETDTYRELHQGYFMQLASQVSVILEKSRLYEELLALNRRLRDMQDRLRHEASHDGLTGIWNRRALLELLGRELARAARDSSPLAAVMLDLDHFKRVNDEHGHLVGDEVLRELVSRLSASLRSGEVFGRLGGEEFLAILVPGNRATAEMVMERARRACEQRPFATSAGNLDITVSLGAAVLDRANGAGASELLGAADRALYSAKQAGRNRWALETLG
jgi:diguanylate cyclase (GGDEF)-like protein